MLSRITGQVRTTLFAALWGVSIYGDIFFVAFKIPNLLRRFFAEGAMSSAFIPVFSKLESNKGIVEKFDGNNQKITELSKEEFYALIFWVMGGVMTLVVWLGIFLAPALARLLFSLQSGDGAKLAEITLLIRVLFPYIALISLCALQQGVLENHGKFSYSASVPVIFNLILIGTTTIVIWLDSLRVPYENWFINSGFYEWWGYQTTQVDKATLLAEGKIENELRAFAKTLLVSGGVIVGGMVQLLYAGVAVRTLGYKIGGSFAWFFGWSKNQKRSWGNALTHPTLKRFIYLLIPVFLASGSYQLQTLLLEPITLSLGEGAVSLLFYANRILEFPLGIIGVAITTTSLPLLAHATKNLSPNHSHTSTSVHASTNSEQSFGDIIESSLKVVWLLFIPIMLVSGFFPETIISLVFQFQAFSHENVLATTRCFLYLLPSLPVLAGYRILFNGFYATENTKTPLYVSLINLFFGLPFAYTVVQFYPYPEMIALSGTVSSLLIFVLTIYLFNQKIGISLNPFFKKNFILAVKVLVGVLPILYITYRLMNPFFAVLYKTTDSLWVTKMWQILELGMFSVWVFFLYGVFLIFLKEPQLLKILERLKIK